MSMNPNPGRELSLESYDGSVIRNIIDADPSPQLIQLARLGISDRIRLAQVQELLPPTGRYNCHGLVFACRRTNIDHPARPVDIDELLRKDLFRQISPPPRLGDIVVYRAINGKIEHTGMVSRIETIGSSRVIFVWSKWGSLNEYEHREEVVPYDYDQIEYWRLNP